MNGRGDGVADAPLVPHALLGDQPPEVESEGVPFLQLDRLTQGEEDWKPGEHPWKKHNLKGRLKGAHERREGIG